jgi:hypothetical protein
LSAPRYYLDNDSSISAVVAALRADQIDVETAADAGLSLAHDDFQIAHVLATGRVLVTGDNQLRGRMEDITRRGGHHPGVLLLPAEKRTLIGPILLSLKLIHDVYSDEEMIDYIEFIPF